VTSVGDGVWDVRTAERLGVGFVGVGRAKERDRLAGAGARAIFDDLSDVAGVLAAVLGA
jgi:phosphoglycolate phosphatase-like HAD superfamily hydrolase